MVLSAILVVPRVAVKNLAFGSIHVKLGMNDPIQTLKYKQELNNLTQ